VIANTDFRTAVLARAGGAGSNNRLHVMSPVIKPDALNRELNREVSTELLL